MALLVNDERLTLRVGAAVLGVTLAAIVFVVTIFGRMQTDGVRVRVYFSQMTAVSEGASVQIAGRVIGALTTIALVRGEDTPPGHPLHGSGGIVAVANIDPTWARKIPRNAEFFVNARSAFAPRYLEIGAPPNKQVPEGFLQEGDEVRGVDPPSLDQILQRTWNSLEDMKRFREAIRPATDALGKSLDQLGVVLVSIELMPDQWTAMNTELRGSIAEARQLSATIEESRLDLASITSIVERTRALITRVDGVVAGMRVQVAALSAAVERARKLIPRDLQRRIEVTIARFEAVVASSEQALAGVRQIGEDIASRRGSLGALASDLELLDDVKELTKVLKRNPWRVVVKPIGAGD